MNQQEIELSILTTLLLSYYAVDKDRLENFIKCCKHFSKNQTNKNIYKICRLFTSNYYQQPVKVAMFQALEREVFKCI